MFTKPSTWLLAGLAAAWLLLSPPRLPFLSPAAAAEGTYVWEAEDYTQLLPPMMVVSSGEFVSGASKGKYISAPASGVRKHAAAGKVVYRFTNLPSGRYKLWARKLWQDGCGNSFRVFVNNQEQPSILGEDGTYGRWQWTALKQVLSLGGPVTVTIAHNEDGTNLDQLCLTSNLRLVPGGGSAIVKANTSPSKAAT